MVLRRLIEEIVSNRSTARHSVNNLLPPRTWERLCARKTIKTNDGVAETVSRGATAAEVTGGGKLSDVNDESFEEKRRSEVKLTGVPTAESAGKKPDVHSEIPRATSARTADKLDVDASLSPEDEEALARGRKRVVEFRERSLPSGPLSRVLHFGGLAAGLAAGTVGEVMRRRLGFGGAGEGGGSSGEGRVISSTKDEEIAASPPNIPQKMPPAMNEAGQSLSAKEEGAAAAEELLKVTLDSSSAKADDASLFRAVFTEANAERLANALTRMRGAALKLGQMLSIQVSAVATHTCYCVIFHCSMNNA